MSNRCFSNPLPLPLHPHAALQISGDSFEVEKWCAAHPNAADHKRIADQIIEFLDAVVPSFGAAPEAGAAAATQPRQLDGGTGGNCSCAPAPAAAPAT